MSLAHHFSYKNYLILGILVLFVVKRAVKRAQNHSINIVSSDVYATLKDAAEQEGVSVRLFVNNLFQNIEKTKDVFAKIFSHLQVIRDENGIGYILDKLQDEVAMVDISKEGMNCNIHEDGIICSHIVFYLPYMHYTEKLGYSEKMYGGILFQEYLQNVNISIERYEKGVNNFSKFAIAARLTKIPIPALSKSLMDEESKFVIEESKVKKLHDFFTTDNPFVTFTKSGFTIDSKKMTVNKKYYVKEHHRIHEIERMENGSLKLKELDYE